MAPFYIRNLRVSGFCNQKIGESSPVDTEVQLYIQNHNVMLISTSQKSFQFFPYYVLSHRQELDFHHSSYICIYIYIVFDKFPLHVTNAYIPSQLLLCKWPAHPTWPPTHRGRQHHLSSGAPCRLPSFINLLDGQVLCSCAILHLSS